MRSLPGFFEADLVVHCGDSMVGSPLHTLVLVDITTGWTECVALLRRSEADVIGALHAVSKRLPFPLLGLGRRTLAEAGHVGVPCPPV